MCISVEKKLEKENSELQRQLDFSRQANRSLKAKLKANERKLSTSERKRKSLMDDRNKQKKALMEAYRNSG